MGWLAPAIGLGTTLLGGWLSKKSDKKKSSQTRLEQMPKFTKEQGKLFEPLWKKLPGLEGNALDYIQNMLKGKNQFKPQELQAPEAQTALSQYEDLPYDQSIEKPILSQFEEEIIPQIMERFAGMGASSSSALNQTLGQAGRKVSMDLAQLRASLGQQNYQNKLQNQQFNVGNVNAGNQFNAGQKANTQQFNQQMGLNAFNANTTNQQNSIQQLLSMLQTGLTSQSEPYIKEGKQSTWSKIAPDVGTTAANLINALVPK